MVDTGTVLALALAGHFLGDWVVQTDRQARYKVWDPAHPYHYAAPLRSGDQLTATGILRDGKEITETDLVRAGWWRSWAANQRHVMGYHLTMAVLVTPAWRGWRLAALLAVSWVTHSIIDRRWTVRWLMRHTGSAAFADTTWGVMAVDQALHLAVLCLTVALLAR